MAFTLNHYCKNDGDSIDCTTCHAAVERIRQQNDFLSIPDSLGDGCNMLRMKRYSECVRIVTWDSDQFMPAMRNTAEVLHQIDVDSFRLVGKVRKANFVINDKNVSNEERDSAIWQLLWTAIDWDDYYSNQLFAEQPLSIFYDLAVRMLFSE